MKRLLALMAFAPLAALAGGSNYGVAPGVDADLAGKVREWPVPTPRFARDPAPAPDGSIYISVMSGNKIARFDPGSAAFEGALWVTLYGNGKLARVDPVAMKVTGQYQLPAGNEGPYAVTVDGAGMVWANEINTDTVVRLEPKSGQMRVVKLPSSNTGIRKMIVDASGRLWYMGSHSGKLGVIE